MKTIISYNKMSKKDKRKIDSQKRILWADFGARSPVTKVVPDKKSDRRKYACRENILLWIE